MKELVKSANPLLCKARFHSNDISLFTIVSSQVKQKALHRIKIHQILIEQFSNFLVPMNSFNNAHLDLTKKQIAIFYRSENLTSQIGSDKLQILKIVFKTKHTCELL